MFKEFVSTIFRWSFGSQNTVTFSDIEHQKHLERIDLLKLSIVSFQKWFKPSRFIVLYNGDDLVDFQKLFDKSTIELYKPIEIISQLKILEKCNPYHFMPQGVFWKWIPFRYDVSCNEVSIDSDIVCINDPVEWKEWLANDSPLLIAPERFEKVNINTCGRFHTHPILKNKKPVNCGIVGHKKGHDYSSTFYEITRYISFGQDHNSLFIDEQGAINVWIYLLEKMGKKHTRLSFEKCSWFRDFVYYLMHGVNVETVHATAWHKDILIKLIDIFKNKILQNECSNSIFVSEIVKSSNNLDTASKEILASQIAAEI